MSTSLNQASYVSGTKDYKFGHNSVPNVKITSAPEDADFSRSAMLFDGSDYRYYCFKSSTKDKMYQFAWTGSSYEWGHQSIKELTISGIPEDADTSNFAMLHDGGAYRLYFKKLGEAVLYQFAWDGSTYAFGAKNSIKEIPITNFPASADLTRFEMLHDGSDYRYYCMSCTNVSEIYQGAFNYGTLAYEFGYKSIPKLTLTSAPDTNTLTNLCMLHDGKAYRLYIPSE